MLLGIDKMLDGVIYRVNGADGFETYRFSEDLGFSLLPRAACTQDELIRQLGERVVQAHDMSGIELPEAEVRVDVKRNKQGEPTFQARIRIAGHSRWQLATASAGYHAARLST